MYDLIRVPLGTADANELFSKANLGNDPFRSISGFPSWSICWLCWYLVIQRRVLLIKYLCQIEKLSIWDGFRSLQWPKSQETPIFPICISGVSTDRSTSLPYFSMQKPCEVSKLFKTRSILHDFIALNLICNKGNQEHQFDRMSSHVTKIRSPRRGPLLQQHDRFCHAFFVLSISSWKLEIQIIGSTFSNGFSGTKSKCDFHIRGGFCKSFALMERPQKLLDLQQNAHTHHIHQICWKSGKLNRICSQTNHGEWPNFWPQTKLPNFRSSHFSVWEAWYGVL